jgi:hypothetical protein
VSGNTGAAAVVEALKEIGQEFSMIFDIVNTYKACQPFVIKVHRLKFTPSGFGVITENAGELSLAATVLADDAITSPDKSKFFKVSRIQA